MGRPMKLTGTNNPIGLIVSQQNSFDDCSLTRAISDNVFSSSAVPLVDLVAMSEVPHPIPFRTRSLSPPEPMVLRLKARESRSPPGLPGGQPMMNKTAIAVLLEPFFLHDTLPFAAGWSSPVARQAHNLKVVGSNPTPAPKTPKSPTAKSRGAFCCLAVRGRVADLVIRQNQPRRPP